VTGRLQQVAPTVQQRLVLLAIIGAAAFGLWSAIERERSVELLLPTGRTIRVALADTPQRRAVGLSGRDHVPHDGMLLLWEAPGRHPIWMFRMRFSLDLVWLDRNGRVVSVLPNVPPCAQEPCIVYEPDGAGKSTAVLELPAGAAAKCKIAAGASVHPGTTRARSDNKLAAFSAKAILISQP
jgi:uncharacterized membrane protein (UPF0127 family)